VRPVLEYISPNMGPTSDYHHKRHGASTKAGSSLYGFLLFWSPLLCNSWLVRWQSADGGSCSTLQGIVSIVFAGGIPIEDCLAGLLHSLGSCPGNSHRQSELPAFVLARTWFLFVYTFHLFGLLPVLEGHPVWLFMRPSHTHSVTTESDSYLGRRRNIRTVIIPRPISTLGLKPSARYRSLGMITVLIWKRACINL
jgi:hypothetical protein